MQRTASYADFTIKRSFKSPVKELYKMFADKQSKELWFGGPNDAPIKHEMDFRVGGTELNSGKFHDGITHVFKARYYDIVPNERIVYAYEMYLNNNRISVSLATIEFHESAEGSELALHESGVFLDGFDTVETRERGTKELMNAVEAALNN
jgi:uncharacterized protein YndB with AHSA1/START domain